MGGAEERDNGRGKDADFEAGKPEEEWVEEGVEGRL